MSVGSVRYTLITLLGSYAAPFRFYYGQHPRYAKLLVRPDSEIVIEGYPRCANSFSVLAFERAQGRRLLVGHHLHAPAQIELGVRYGLPVLALIREPVNAAASLITRHPEITPEQALRQYVNFYECVQRHADHLVIADFRKITTDYASVIDKVNHRFGKQFKPYFNSPSEDEKIFRDIDALNAQTEGGAEHQLARPSNAKNALLNDARRRIESDPLTARARAVFEHLIPICV